MMDNRIMKNHLPMALFILVATLAVSGLALAQDSEQAGDEDGSSERVESSDDAYRRRMELEDARRQDPSYTDPVDSYKKDLEKIDKLPEESRENIRDQLVDVIVKNGEWEPSDALDEYPYEPTEAAKGDPVLMEQEQEAWDEQIEKYHEREAAAFGAYRGPVPGPGNPTGQQGGQPGSQGSEQGQQGQGSGQGQGGQGSGQSGAGSPGTYEYQSNRSGSEDEVSTDGVSESALDFLKGRQGQAGAAGKPGSAGSEANQAGGAQTPSSSSSQSPQDEAPSTDGAQQSAAQWAAQQADSAQGEEAQQSTQDQSESSDQQSEQQSEEQQEQASPESEQEIRGIIAIEDLDKLEGAVTPEEDETGSENDR
jgi:hypothetical protein